MEIHSPFNSLPPVDRLPIETIIEILHISLPSDERSFPYSRFAPSYYGQLWNLRRVCKRWASVIDGTPSYWTAVSSQIPRHINSAVLLRSSGRPLTIYSMDRSSRRKTDDPELLELITPVRASWKNLAIESANSEHFIAWLTAPAPNLEKINLSYPSHLGRLAKCLALLGGRTKNIREVSITSVPLAWSRDMFYSLRVLKLCGPNLEIGTDHILSFLFQNPSLEILDLSNVTNSARTSNTIHHNIALSHLRTLNVAECDEELTRAVLRHITAPPLLSSLRIRLPSYRTSNGEALLTETSALFQPALRSAHKVSSESILRICDGNLDWKVKRDTMNSWVDVLIAAVSTSFACGWINQTLELDGLSETGVELVVGHYDYPHLDESRLSSLGSLLCVTKLSIYTNSQDAQALLQLLGGDYGFGTSAPSLPHLQELELAGSHRGLLPAVQRRFSRINSPDEPPDLKIFIVSDGHWSNTRLSPIMDGATVMAIRKVKGVQSLSFVLDSNTAGKPAITWSDELAIPIYGGGAGSDGIYDW